VFRWLPNFTVNKTKRVHAKERRSAEGAKN